MSELAEFLKPGLNVMLFGVLFGLGFTLGMMLICKAFRWAPINTTVNTSGGDALVQSTPPK